MTATAFNSAKKAQFLERTGSYSTRGSRRGFVDADLPVDASQLESAKDRVEYLLRRRLALQKVSSDLRKECSVPKGCSPRRYEKYARKGIFRNSRSLSQKLLELINVCDQLTEIQAEYTEATQQKKAAAKRVHQSERDLRQAMRNVLPDATRRLVLDEWHRLRHLREDQE